MYEYPSNIDITGFSTEDFYNEGIDIKTEFVIVEGINETTEKRIKSWKEKGYRVHICVNLSWGPYADYLNGSWDDEIRWDHVQTDEMGNPILHGPNVPHIVPTMKFAEYICEKIYPLLDAGVEAVHLKEPEFWAKSGYSAAFKKEWEIFYKKSWEAPNSSQETQFKASYLKARIYYRCIYFLGCSLKSYSKFKHDKDLMIYVQSNGFLSCSQEGLISPISNIAECPAIDGFIANINPRAVKIKTADEMFTKTYFFETALMEYEIMFEQVRKSGMDIWFSHSPSDEMSLFSWEENKKNYEQSLAASLMIPDVHKYKVCEKPEILFNKKNKNIPKDYAASVLVCIDALKKMKNERVRWETPNDNVIGVCISDTAMFQRIYPQNDVYSAEYNDDIDNFSCLFGITLPFLSRGIFINLLSLERIDREYSFLNEYNVLILSYEFIKPKSSSLHYALLAWVKSGGILIYAGNDSDSFNNMNNAWWKNEKMNYPSPSAHLFDLFGVSKKIAALKKKNARGQFQRQISECIFDIEKGAIAFFDENPALCAREPAYAHMLRKIVFTAAEKINIEFKRKNVFSIYRGPYNIITVLDNENNGTYIKKGNFVYLFDNSLAVREEITVNTGESRIYYDIDAKKDDEIGIIAISAGVSDYSYDSQGLAFTATVPAGISCICRLFMPFSCTIKINGQTIKNTRDSVTGKTVFFKFNSVPGGARVEATRTK